MIQWIEEIKKNNDQDMLYFWEKKDLLPEHICQIEDLIKAVEILSEALGKYSEVETLLRATPNNQWAQSALKQVEDLRK